MRLACTTALLCLSFIAYSQDQNSLLWEISGNGLEKSSYLYGTMHVSKKIAFRLDDVFFEALDKSDIIALESDPDTWLENEVQRGPDGYGFGYGFDSKGFYREAFVLEPPSIKDLSAYIAFDDRLINNILYRTNEYAQNFEEETYLDMFIYQAGAKFGKPVVALENLEESATLVARASLNAIKNKPDEWLQKRMQSHDLNYLMQDAYRERNIALLDSIDRAMYTDYYRLNMLYIRNENMAGSLDSIMHRGKVFAGIGAAHLPGEHGVIQLLRDKGYTVKPLVSESSSFGKQLKKKFEDQIRLTPLKESGPEDHSFSMLLPNKLYPVSEKKSTVYVSPDLANGSYVMVNRIPTYGPIKEEGRYKLEDIESMLFENIPGDIIHKSRIERSGTEGLDILNRLKNGDYQRYQIFVRPLEIVIFKMAGDGDYVKDFSEPIFSSLRFRVPAGEKLTLKSAYSDFSIRVPGEYTFYNPSRTGVRMIEGFDESTGDYYFLRRASLLDFKSIEEDAFELKQIHKRFHQDLDLEPIFGEIKNHSLRSEAGFDDGSGKKLYLKTVINRSDYYLMGILTRRASEAESFMDSFHLMREDYPEEFETIRDTAMLFTTLSPVSPKKFVENSNGYFRRKSKVKPYNPFTKKTRYQNKNNEAITVELNKAHDYLSFPNIDSLWSIRKNQYVKKDFRISRERIIQKGDQIHELEFIATDSLSSRGILVKNIVRGGLLYEIKAVVDTLTEPSRFVTEFYNNFQPLDTLVGKEFIKDKSAEFFAALRAKDSIILKGYRFPFYNETHIDSLKYYISGFNYDQETKHIQSYLIQKLGALEDPSIWDFFTEYYQMCYGNSMAQVKILQSLAKEQSPAATKMLLSLMARDLPLVSNSKEIARIFEPFRKEKSLAKLLYPKMMEFSTVQEYKLEIISLLADLKSEHLIRTNSYKKFLGTMTSDARMQLKRHLARQGNYQRSRSSQVLNRKQNNEILEDYAILLYPFMKEKDVQQFFNHLIQVKAPNVRATHAMLLAQRNEHIPMAFIDSLAGDINSRSLIFEKLRSIDKLHLFPSVYRVQEAMAESAIFEDRNFVASKEEVIYLGERTMNYQDKMYTGYYFKLRSQDDFDKSYRVHVVVYENGSEVDTKYFYKSDGYRMADTDSEETAMEYVTEEFYLKDRSRAMVYHSDTTPRFSRLGY